MTPHSSKRFSLKKKKATPLSSLAVVRSELPVAKPAWPPLPLEQTLVRRTSASAEAATAGPALMFVPSWILDIDLVNQGSAPLWSADSAACNTFGASLRERGVDLGGLLGPGPVGTAAGMTLPGCVFGGCRHPRA